jgi:hypothetical protein
MARALEYVRGADSAAAAASSAAVDWLAFDLDHALLRYRVPALMEHIYHCLVGALTAAGQPAAAFAAGWAGPRCVAKGLVVDWHTGDVLKLDAAGFVAAAVHGASRRAPASVAAVYGGAPWPGFAALAAHRRSPAFHYFQTYFDMPAILLAQQLVAWRGDEAAPAPAPAAAEYEAGAAPAHYAREYAALLAAFSAVFDNEAAWDGPFFAALRQRPADFVWPRPALRASLARMRGGGRRVALVTNSHIFYACAMLEAALGADWRDVFDVVIFNAQKPAFFSRALPAFRACDWARWRACGRPWPALYAPAAAPSPSVLPLWCSRHHGRRFCARSCSSWSWTSPICRHATCG